MHNTYCHIYAWTTVVLLTYRNYYYTVRYLPVYCFPFAYRQPQPSLSVSCHHHRSCPDIDGCRVYNIMFLTPFRHMHPYRSSFVAVNYVVSDRFVAVPNAYDCTVLYDVHSLQSGTVAVFCARWTGNVYYYSRFEYSRATPALHSCTEQPLRCPALRSCSFTNTVDRPVHPHTCKIPGP